MVYDSSENKQDILFTHLRYGEKDAGSWPTPAPEESPREVRSQMEAHGIDAKGLAQRGRLSIANYDQVYIKKGSRFDKHAVVSHFSHLANESRKKGLMGLRAAAEMSCFFKHGMMMELAEYEHALGRQFTFPGMGICAYNVMEMQSSGYLDRLLPILREHRRVIRRPPRELHMGA